MQGFTILDIIISVVIIFFTFNGYKKGFIKQTSKILGLLVALFVAIKQYQQFQTYLTPYLDVPPPVLHFISFALIFVLFNLVIHILGIVVKKIINFLFLEPLDHLAGAVLGLLKGGILIYLIVFILSEIPYDAVIKIVDESYLATSILEITPVLQQNLQEIFKSS